MYFKQPLCVQTMETMAKEYVTVLNLETCENVRQILPLKLWQGVPEKQNCKQIQLKGIILNCVKYRHSS